MTSLTLAPVPALTRMREVTQRLARALPDIIRLLHADRWVYALIALHALCAVVLLGATGQTASLAFASYLGVWPFAFLVLMPTLYLLAGLLRMVHRLDRRRPLAIRQLFSARRVSHFAAGALLLAALMIFQGSFTSVKNALPGWNGGFLHDVVQADWDKFLHFGTDPWRYLIAVADAGWARSLIEWNYNQGWFVFCYGTLFWIAVAPEAARIRTRYMLSYVLLWTVVGNLMAGLFISAGPAFYHHVTGDETRFADLLAFLGQGEPTMHSAATIQAYLWSLYSAREAGFASGISAFPSMHVALVTLNALFIAEWSRRLGLLAFAYVALVVASSVYLAWHYAIDGYVSVVVTVALYYLLRRFVRDPGGSAKAAATPPPR